MKFFSLDSKFYRIMMSMGEMMILNFCWIVACLPLITIGAALTYRLQYKQFQHTFF